VIIFCKCTLNCNKVHCFVWLFLLNPFFLRLCFVCCHNTFVYWVNMNICLDISAMEFVNGGFTWHDFLGNYITATCSHIADWQLFNKVLEWLRILNFSQPYCFDYKITKYWLYFC
jgi:hypothetical protein